jgi:hypothetical protein
LGLNSFSAIPALADDGELVSLAASCTFLMHCSSLFFFAVSISHFSNKVIREVRQNMSLLKVFVEKSA